MSKEEKGVRAAVIGIIVQDGKVLLTKRSQTIAEPGKWCLPGGYMMFGEEALESLQREVKEETGLDLEKSEFLFYQEENVSRLNLSTVVLVFRTEAKGVLELNEEVVEFKYFEKKEIEKIDLAYRHKDILNRFFEMEGLK